MNTASALTPGSQPAHLEEAIFHLIEKTCKVLKLKYSRTRKKNSFGCISQNFSSDVSHLLKSRGNILYVLYDKSDIYK